MAEMVQLAIEYDPQPPFDAGSPAKAPEALVAAVKEVIGTGPSLAVAGRGGRQ
jgi:hypothetical protein